jgi:hypothetical protein
MKNYIFASLIFIVFVSFASIQQSYVYVCKGPASKVYHKSERCRGRSHCSTEVYKVTLKEAQEIGRRACKIEY